MLRLYFNVAAILNIICYQSWPLINIKHEQPLIYEPRHEISNDSAYVTSNASDQPAHMRSLIRAFASRLNILLALSYWLNSIWSF